MLTEKLQKILKCKICREYVAHCMVEPLRCGGLHYDEDGRLITENGVLWEDIENKNNQKNKDEMEKFLQEYGEHIKNHLR